MVTLRGLPAGRVGGVTIAVVADVAGPVLAADRVPDPVGLLGPGSVPVAVAVEVPVLVPDLRVVQHPVAVLVDAVALLPAERVDGGVPIVAVLGVPDLAGRAGGRSRPLRRTATVAVTVVVGEAGREAHVVVDRPARVAVLVDAVRRLHVEREAVDRRVVAITPGRRVHDLDDRGARVGHGARQEHRTHATRTIAVEVDCVELRIDDRGVGRRAVTVAVVVDAVAVAVVLRFRVDGSVRVVAVTTLPAAAGGPAVAVVVGDRAATGARGRGLEDVVVVRGVRPGLLELDEPGLLKLVGELRGVGVLGEDLLQYLRLLEGVRGATTDARRHEQRQDVEQQAGHVSPYRMSCRNSSSCRGHFLEEKPCQNTTSNYIKIKRFCQPFHLDFAQKIREYTSIWIVNNFGVSFSIHRCTYY